MDPDLPAVLLMGGGEGMGPVKKTAKALGESLYDKESNKPIGQLIIICGRNKNLAMTLESEQWKIPVKVFCIIDNFSVNNLLWPVIASNEHRVLLASYMTLNGCKTMLKRYQITNQTGQVNN